MRTARVFQCTAVVSLFLIIPVSGFPDVIHVDGDALPGGDGKSWATAFNMIQDALDIFTSGDEIRVAEGTYLPSLQLAPPDPRSATFSLIDDLTMLGGYAGCGHPDPDERDITAYPSTLSGDLNGDDGPDFTNRSDNCYHIVHCQGPTSMPTIDGFTIYGGQSFGADPVGAGVCIFGTDVSISNCTFKENGADQGGGGLYSLDASPTLTDCLFQNNRSNISGGGAYISGGSPVLIQCDFSRNTASAQLHWEDSEGGGLHLRNCDFTLTGCSFTDNNAHSKYLEEYGAGLYLFFCLPSSTLTSCSFTDNRVYFPGDGGGMYIRSSSPTLDHCTFSGNNQTALFLRNNSSPVLNSCTFNENEGTSGGALVCSHESSPILNQCQFLDNFAYNGGAIHLWGDSNAQLSHCVVDNNTADSGGGMLSQNSSPVITDCSFKHNTATTITKYGGAIAFIQGGFPMVSGCKFQNNVSGTGGALLTSAAYPTITDCRFIGNFASIRGGGIVNYDGMSLINCIFADNSSEYGGGICNYSASKYFTDIVNCTFSRNHADIAGGAAYNFESTLQFINSILWEDTSGSPPAISEIHNQNAKPTVIYCDVQGGWPGEGNLDLDPQFVNPVDGNYHLSRSSPCIDNGNHSVFPIPGTDFEGDPRIFPGNGSGYSFPMSALVDMGADEYCMFKKWVYLQTR